MASAEEFHALTPPETMENLELVEADMRLEKALTNNEEVGVEFTR
jgi:hypothetical protein